MLAVLDNTATLKKIIDAIKDLCKETNIEIDAETGLIIKSMDSSHVSLIKLDLKDAFSKFEVEKPSTISLNLESLSKILKVCDNDATLSLTLSRSKLHLEASADNRNTKFALHLMDIEMESMDVPEMDFPIKITMPSTEYTRLCRDFSQFGDTLTLAVKDDCIEFSIEGDCGNGSVTLYPSDKILIEFGMCIELSLAVKYLLLFSKAAPISDIVTIELGENLPVKITFPISAKDKIAYFLAPKCE